jgi:diguanylate cyclase (GGDEF)-like protein
VLFDVAQALSRVLRSQDTVARLGGDEFCVIAPETDNPLALAEKVKQAVGYVAAGHRSLTTSVGIAVFPDDGSGIKELLRVADDRLVAAKARRHERQRRLFAA